MLRIQSLIYLRFLQPSAIGPPSPSPFCKPLSIADTLIDIAFCLIRWLLLKVLNCLGMYILREQFLDACRVRHFASYCESKFWAGCSYGTSCAAVLQAEGPSYLLITAYRGLLLQPPAMPYSLLSLCPWKSFRKNTLYPAKWAQMQLKEVRH
jgi:hypothetical protein